MSQLVSRVPFLILAVATLLLALWGGLLRMGWGLPSLTPALAAAHGPVVVCGFLGTLVALERAVAVERRWAYSAPLLFGLGALLAGVAGPRSPGPLLATLGSAALLAIFAVIWRRQPALPTATMAAGAGAWLIGNALWALALPIANAVPWWLGAFVLTIAGERLELGRLLRLPRSAEATFATLLALFFVGIVVPLPVALSGLALLLLSLWLLRYDVARRTLRRGGLPRFSAVGVLSGYVWLGVGGLIWLAAGDLVGGLHYDAILHAVFVGFVLAMVFAHAPIIFPAVLGIPVPFRERFYAHLALLWVGLALRLGSDLLEFEPGRQWGALLNVLAVLLFLASTAAVALPGLRLAGGDGGQVEAVEPA